MAVRRLRVIAGPNGSGKSSIFPRIQDRVRMGRYLSPDELGLTLQRTGSIDRAYLFDNSGAQMELIMESNGKDLRLMSQAIPAWLEDHLIIPLRQGEAR